MFHMKIIHVNIYNIFKITQFQTFQNLYQIIQKTKKNIFSNDSEYPLNKNISPDLFTGNFEQLNNNFNDDLSESGYINRNFDTNFDEIYESLTYYVSAEK